MADLHSVFSNKMSNTRLAHPSRVYAPAEKSWIHHWISLPNCLKVKKPQAQNFMLSQLTERRKCIFSNERRSNRNAQFYGETLLCCTHRRLSPQGKHKGGRHASFYYVSNIVSLLTIRVFCFQFNIDVISTLALVFIII